MSSKPSDPSTNGPGAFNEVESDSIEDSFPPSQKPLHFYFRTSIRYRKVTYPEGVVALSPHFIGLFLQDRLGQPFKCFEMIHISNVLMIAHKENEFALVKTRESNMTCTGPPTTRFAQLLYRNYYFSFSLNSPDDIIEVRSDNLNLFPDITIHASPSQKFQFAYLAMSTAQNMPYNHEVVRYLHNLLLSHSSIVDISQIPLDLANAIDFQNSTTQRFQPIIQQPKDKSEHKSKQKIESSDESDSDDEKKESKNNKKDGKKDAKGGKKGSKGEKSPKKGDKHEKTEKGSKKEDKAGKGSKKGDNDKKGEKSPKKGDNDKKEEKSPKKGDNDKKGEKSPKKGDKAEKSSKKGDKEEKREKKEGKSEKGKKSSKKTDEDVQDRDMDLDENDNKGSKKTKANKKGSTSGKKGKDTKNKKGDKSKKNEKSGKEKPSKSGEEKGSKDSDNQEKPEPSSLSSNEPMHRPSDLAPIFNSLNLMRFISGICACNFYRPDLIQAFIPLVSLNNNLRIVNFENCGARYGLRELVDEIQKVEKFSVSYWNLAGNELEHFESFAHIIELTQEPLLYLNLSYCKIDSQASASIFKALSENDCAYRLRFLLYAGNDMSGKDAQNGFEMFMKALERNRSQLEYLDLGSLNGSVDQLLGILNKYRQPIQTLVLRGSNIDDTTLNQLKTFIHNSSTLRTLDLSYTQISPETVAEVINQICKNDNLEEFSLRLNGLNLHDENLLPLFREFLNRGLLKWKALSFDNNNMDEKDLRNLLPLFLRMKNLKELSLNGNFDRSMEGIDEILVELLDIKKIETLSIAGSQDRKLGDMLSRLLKQMATSDSTPSGRPRSHIHSLDVSSNGFGDGLIPYINQILHAPNSQLQKLNIDNNNFSSTDKLASLVEAVDGCYSLISFRFPFTDAKNIITRADNSEKDVIIRTLSEMQIGFIQGINSHRNKQKLPNDLPFPADEEIQKLVYEISRNMSQRFRLTDMKRHSLVCEELSVPLPFQKIGDIPREGGKIEDVDIGNMTVYQTPSMGEYVIEENMRYTELFTTQNPDMMRFQDPNFMPPPMPYEYPKPQSSSPEPNSTESDSSKAIKERSPKQRGSSSDSNSSDYDRRSSKRKRPVSYSSSDDGKRRSKRRYRYSYSDSDDDSYERDSEDIVGHKNRRSNKSKTQKHQYSSGSSSDSDAYNDKRKAPKRRSAKKYYSDSSDSSESSNDGSSSSDYQERSPKSKRLSQLSKRRNEYSSDSSESSSYEERRTLKRSQRSAKNSSKKRSPDPKMVPRKRRSSSSSSSHEAQLETKLYGIDEDLDNLVSINYNSSEVRVRNSGKGKYSGKSAPPVPQWKLEHSSDSDDNKFSRSKKRSNRY